MASSSSTANSRDPESAFEYFAQALGFSKRWQMQHENEGLGVTQSPLYYYMSTLSLSGSSDSAESAEPGSSLRPSNLSLAARIAGSANSFSAYLETILTTSQSRTWPKDVRARLMMLSCLNYYMWSSFEEALEVLLTLYKQNKIVSFITNLDSYKTKYGWNKKLSHASFRHWLTVEYEDILDLEESEKRQALVSGRIPAQYLNEELNENSTNGDDPIKEMLAYLLQVI